MRRMKIDAKGALIVVCIWILALLTGCGEVQEETNSAGSGATKIVFQTDWYAQPEHGGFYQALVNGFYAEEGLDVEILQGGPNANTMQKAALGVAQFSMGRSDQIIEAVAKGVPVVIIAATMQKDPQGIMFHRESGIDDFKDLDGRTIMAVPGLPFVDILRMQYDIELSVIPSDFGVDRFLADPSFVQQVFVTNEPYYAAQHGADPGVLLFSETGFRPYHVWYTSRSFARQNPEAVLAFTRASIKGWRDYLFGDRSEANALIADLNPKMSKGLIRFSVESMLEHELVTGEGGDPADIGKIDPERLATQIEQLVAIGFLDQPIPVESIFDDRFLRQLGKLE